MEQNETLVVTKVGDLCVFSSGVAHVQKGKNLRLEFDELKMDFEFLEDDKNARYETDLKEDGKLLIWKLFNFKNSLGEGKLDPIRLGSTRGKELYASFFVLSVDVNAGYRIISYSLYLGKEVPDNSSS